MALSVCYWANYTLTKEKLQQKSESGAQNQQLSLINRSQSKVNTQDFGALLLLTITPPCHICIRLYCVKDISFIAELSLRIVIMLQSQDEVCDLKHAAPFQNIIPKPFVDYKGE